MLLIEDTIDNGYEWAIWLDQRASSADIQHQAVIRVCNNHVKCCNKRKNHDISAR